LDELLKTSEFIKNKAKTEETFYAAATVLPKMNSNTTPSKLVISASLDPNQVDLLCATQEELKELSDLRVEVLELENNTPEKLREEYKNRRLRIVPLQVFLTSLINELGSEKFQQIKELHEKKVQTKNAADLSSKSTFSVLPISEIGSEEWITMWKSVKNFIECLNNNFPVLEGDHCPTCLQVVDHATAARLLTFDEYLQNELQKEAAIALDNWNTVLKKIKKLNFSKTPYEAILNDIKSKDEAFSLLLYNLIDQLNERAKSILKDIPSFDFDDINLESFTRLNTHILKLEELEKTVLNDDSKIKSILLKKQRILEIEDREKIISVKDQIKEEIKKAKKNELFSKITSTYILLGSIFYKFTSRFI